MMPSGAVALANPDDRAPGTRAPRNSFRPRRLHAILIAIGLIAIWLAFVFARALGDLDQATARQQAIAQEAVALQARLDADHRELALVQTDAFQALQARAYGLGGPGELVFSLPQDAPSPAPITPLGGSPADASASGATPLDAWLEILFGN